MCIQNGYIYINSLNNVVICFNDITIEYIGSQLLKEIKSILKFDKKIGYLEIETNYGEEFYCLKETLKDLNLENKIDLRLKLKNIQGFKILRRKKMQKTPSQIRDKAFMIVNNIAMLFCKTNSSTRLRVYDINNLKYCADFIYSKDINAFNLVQSSFADGKRKYEMLYIIERNKEELIKGMQNA